MIQIKKVSVYAISLPFKGDFSHARSKGAFSRNIIVEVIAARGEITGYGEGALRFYSPYESDKTALRNAVEFMQKDTFPWQLDHVSRIWDFVDSLPENRDLGSVVCALEMALLDAYSKSKGVNIISNFNTDYLTDNIRYGATIPLAKTARVYSIARMIKKMGIRHLRIKLGKDTLENKKSLEAVRDVFGSDCELRIDPNGIWDRYIAFQHLGIIQKYNIKIVEEPIADDDYGLKTFSYLMRALGVTLMACQSAPTLTEVERLAEDGMFGMVNVKLSRCGGFRRSLRMIDFLRRKGIAYQIGCNRGESGILSSAGRILGLISKDAVYYDGSYDSFILKENTTVDDVSFEAGGVARLIEGPGLGVQISKENINRLRDNATTINVLRW